MDTMTNLCWYVTITGLIFTIVYLILVGILSLFTADKRSHDDQAW